jgi:hypothetical protein
MVKVFEADASSGIAAFVINFGFERAPEFGKWMLKLTD